MHLVEVLYLRHVSFIRWFVKKCGALIKRKLYFEELSDLTPDVVVVNECLKQINLSISLHTCASYLGQPSNIKTMTLRRIVLKL